MYRSWWNSTLLVTKFVEKVGKLLTSVIFIQNNAQVDPLALTATVHVTLVFSDAFAFEDSSKLSDEFWRHFLKAIFGFSKFSAKFNVSHQGSSPKFSWIWF